MPSRPKANPRKRTQDAQAGSPILLIDAGLAAGWRRAEPDLDQLDAVVAVARDQVADCVVLAEASLKWSLPADQQDRFEQDRANAKVLCAPGGTEGGHHGFLASVAHAAAAKGRDVIVLSALDLGDGPWRRATLRRPEGHWRLEMDEDP